MSHLIACVHATPRAIPPTRRMLGGRAHEFAQHDVLEEPLFQLDAASDEGFRAFLAAIRQAELLHPSAVLTTCSMYTQHLPAVRSQLTTPIVGIDEAMIQRAAEVRGRLALVGSRPESIAFTGRQIEAKAGRRGSRPEFAEPLCVPADACDTVSGTRQLAEQLNQLAGQVDVVVVVQLSLSPVSDHLSDDVRRRVLTGPPLALQQLRTVLGGTAS
jgi:hypothetical protein